MGADTIAFRCTTSAREPVATGRLHSAASRVRLGGSATLFSIASAAATAGTARRPAASAAAPRLRTSRCRSPVSRTGGLAGALLVPDHHDQQGPGPLGRGGRCRSAARVPRRFSPEEAGWRAGARPPARVTPRARLRASRRGERRSRLRPSERAIRSRVGHRRVPFVGAAGVWTDPNPADNSAQLSAVYDVKRVPRSVAVGTPPTGTARVACAHDRRVPVATLHTVLGGPRSREWAAAGSAQLRSRPRLDNILTCPHGRVVVRVSTRRDGQTILLARADKTFNYGCSVAPRTGSRSRRRAGGSSNRAGAYGSG